MRCTRVQVGSTSAIVCSRTPRKRRCCACRLPAELLCDAVKGGGTCDAPLCTRCAVVIGRDRHRCPSCELRAQGGMAAETVREAPPRKPSRAPGRRDTSAQLGLFAAPVTP